MATASQRETDVPRAPGARGVRELLALVGAGALVGLAGGGVVVVFRLALSAAEKLLRALTQAAAGTPALMAGWACALVVIGCALCALVAWEPHTSGSGIPQVAAELKGRLSASWRRVIPAKLVEGTLCALAGLSLGREGPSVQLGAMAGKAVGEALGADGDETVDLLGAGAGAGVAAAFNAPVAGAVFAVEEMRGRVTVPLVATALPAALVANLVASLALGWGPELALGFEGELPATLWPWALALGLACGALGWAHNRLFFASQDASARLGRRAGRWGTQARLAVPLACAFVVAFVAPELMCGGDAILELLEEPAALTLGLVAALLAGKLLYTALCFGSGAPGGTLLPLVVVGALAGALWGLGLQAMGLADGSYLANFVALGIAGMLASVVRAPVTGIVLVFELTGTPDGVLLVALVAFVSYLASDALGCEAFYEHLLEGLLEGL